MKIQIHKSNCRSLEDIHKNFPNQDHEWAVSIASDDELQNSTNPDDCYWLGTFETKQDAIDFKNNWLQENASEGLSIEEGFKKHLSEK